MTTKTEAEAGNPGTELIDQLATSHMMKKLGLKKPRLSPGTAELHIPDEQSKDFYHGMMYGLSLASSWLGEGKAEGKDLTEIAEHVSYRYQGDVTPQ